MELKVKVSILADVGYLVPVNDFVITYTQETPNQQFFKILLI